MITEIQNFPEDFNNFPNADVIEFLFASRQSDKKTFKLTLEKLASSLQIESVEGMPVQVTGTVLPSPLNSSWTILLQGTYTHVNGGFTVPVKNLGIAFYNQSTNTWTLSQNMGASGLDGRGIVDVEKTGTAGLVDTYTIEYTDATTSTFNVSNGEDGTNAIPFRTKGTKELYSELPTSGNAQDDAYYVKEDGLIYVWTERELPEISSFPPIGDGIPIQSGFGEDVVDIAELPTFYEYDDQNFGHSASELVWRAI